ncbi:hypothetical protein ACB092_12G156700 [Castanea dentata]
MHDSDQACTFFKWLDKNTCPRGRATAPLMWERFTRLSDEAMAARNERDVAHAMEAEARERERIAKRKAEKSNLALRIAEDKVYEYRLALLLLITVVGVILCSLQFLGVMAIHKCVCHDSFTVTCVMYITDYMPCFELLYILQGAPSVLLYAFPSMQLSNVKFPCSSGNIF